MTLPKLTIQIADPGRGAVNTAPNASVVFGYIAGGSDPAGLNTINDLEDVRPRLGFSPYAEDVARILVEAGGPVLLSGILAATAGTAGLNSAVDRVGGPTATLTGDARETYTGQVEVVEEGVLGAARIRYTLDNHDPDTFDPTYSPNYTVPSNGSFAMGDSGLTFEFPDLPYTSAVVESGTDSKATAPTLTGTPSKNVEGILEITTGGDRATAVFKWSDDGGDSYTTGVTTAATNLLTGTGITVNWNNDGGGDPDYSVGTIYTFHAYVTLPEGATWTFSTKPARLSPANITTLSGYISASQKEPEMWIVSGTADTDEEGSANAAALGTALSSFATGNRFSAGLLDVGSGDVVADVVAEAADWTDKRICPVYTQHYIQSALPYEGFTVRKVGALTSVAARACRVLISTDLARVAEGSLGGVVGIEFDGNSDPSVDDVGISCLRTWPGAAGFYIGKARIKAPPGSDFTDLHFRRILDMACRTLRDAMLQFSSEGFRTLEGGTLDPRDAADIEAVGNEALANVLLRQSNARGVGGHVSAVSVTVDLSHNIISTSQLKVKLRVRPLGYANEIIMNVGFTTA